MLELGALLITMLAYGQGADSTSQFEVASVKVVPNEAGLNFSRRGGPGTDDPTLFAYENGDLKGILVQAFNVRDYAVSGPDWLRPTRVTIHAKVPQGATKEQLRVMLQNLLIERFKLAYHHEDRQIASYELVLAKGGPKLTEHTPSADDTPPALYPSITPKNDGDGFPILPPGPYNGRMARNGRKTTQQFYNASMEQFAGLLGASAERPVFDATGLKGKYDFLLRWIDNRRRPAEDEQNSPTLFEALEKQLGLKLESKRTPIQVLVIDHMEKAPTEN